MKSVISIPLAAVLLTGSMARAAFVVVDHFDSYTAGSSASGQSADWTSTGGANTVIDTGSGNNAITVDENGDGVRYNNTGSFSIPDSSLTTTFFQVYFASDSSNSSFQDFRILDSTSTSSANAQVALSFRKVSTGSSVQTIAGAGGAGTELQLNDSRISFDTLYNVWVVVDSTADAYSVYMSTGTDTAVGLETVGGTGTASVGFLTAQTADLDYIYLRNSSGNSTGSSYFDSIHFDSTGMNLVNPIPEPSTLLLVALPMTLLGLRRMRRRR